MKNNPNSGIGLLYELAEKKVPLANYKMAMLLYFHPELTLNFGDYLKQSCEMGESQGIIATANLLFQNKNDSLAINLLNYFKQYPEVNNLLLTLNTKNVGSFSLHDIDFSALKRFDLSLFSNNSIASEINLFTVDNFINEFECNWLINRAKENIRRSEVVNGDTGKNEISDVRTGSVAQLLPTLNDWVVLNIEKKISQYLAISMTHGELCNVLHYAKEQQYKAHYDFFHPNDPGANVAKADGGQRYRTALIYLNDNFTGGETSFSRLNKSVKPKSGRLVVFNNTDNQYQPLPLSLHQGMPVLSGEKWLFSKWIREQGTSYKNILIDLNL